MKTTDLVNNGNNDKNKYFLIFPGSYACLNLIQLMK